MTADHLPAEPDPLRFQMMPPLSGEEYAALEASILADGCAIATVRLGRRRSRSP